MSQARKRLDDLKVAAASTRRVAITRRRTRARPDDILPGRRATCRGKPYWLLETPFNAICRRPGVSPQHLSTPLRHPHPSTGAVTIDPRRAMVVDIETGGFAGMPVFLIGLVLLDERPLAVRQLLARDYPEEETIVAALARLAKSRDTWITFNGKSFDVPFLIDRATLHRVPLVPPAVHVDLLHAARRRWGRNLPNCRLATLETQILKRPRVGDIPSADVPDLFHYFIHTGRAGPLLPVLEHNQIDLLSSTELLVKLA
jgi:uncharacterized protein YprB with RNaseH-like and TPR domain